MAWTAATLQQSKYKQPTLGGLCLQVSKTHKSLSIASGDVPRCWLWSACPWQELRKHCRRENASFLTSLNRQINTVDLWKTIDQLDCTHVSTMFDACVFFPSAGCPWWNYPHLDKGTKSKHVFWIFIDKLDQIIMLLNIEFHSLSLCRWWQFVAMSAMSIQLKRGWNQQRIHTQNDPINLRTEWKKHRKLNCCYF